MMRAVLKIEFCFLLLLIIGIGCKKPYNPPATSTNYNNLVVEGIINTGADSTIIQLSRTITINARATTNPELNATATVESDQNTTFTLKNIGNGKYAMPGLNTGSTHNYRLRIKTSDNKEYLSDFVQPKVSPPIDSITREITGTGLNIYSYTHDPANNTHYYRWEYQETYLYYSPVYSQFIFNGTSIVLTTPKNEINTCYISDTSSHVILNSSAKLSQDIITRNLITPIPFNTDKLKLRYSILIKQYALTADAYNFYTSLAKNTESLGSIFDAQPSQLVGNIHCITNPSEPVIGFLSVGVTVQQRIFIDRTQLPAVPIGVDYSFCGVAGLSYERKQITPYPDVFTTGSEVPTDTPIRIYNPKLMDTVYTYSYATPQCTDCTLKGSNQKPAFWIDK